MKKTYQAPETEVILFEASDILTLSVGATAAQKGDGMVIKDLNSLIGSGKMTD